MSSIKVFCRGLKSMLYEPKISILPSPVANYPPKNNKNDSHVTFHLHTGQFHHTYVLPLIALSSIWGTRTLLRWWCVSYAWRHAIIRRAGENMRKVRRMGPKNITFYLSTCINSLQPSCHGACNFVGERKVWKFIFVPCNVNSRISSKTNFTSSRWYSSNCGENK